MSNNVKNDDHTEPRGADEPTKMRSCFRTDAGKGKRKPMRREDSEDVKERQSLKIKELSDALAAAGLFSLDEQAAALGLSRSTTWTILKARHKNYGLSGSVINRILQRRGLDRYVRAKLIEYVQEKALGYYGHNEIQLRRFKQRLSAATTPAYPNILTKLKATTNRADGAS